MKHLTLYEKFQFGDYNKITKQEANDFLEWGAGISNIKGIGLTFNERFRNLIREKFIENEFEVFVNALVGHKLEPPFVDPTLQIENCGLYIKGRKTIGPEVSDDCVKFLNSRYDQRGKNDGYKIRLVVFLTIYELPDEYFIVEWKNGTPGEVSRFFFSCDQIDGLLKLLDDKLSYFK